MRDFPLFGREENRVERKWWQGEGVFSPWPPNSYLSKTEGKLGRNCGGRINLLIFPQEETLDFLYGKDWSEVFVIEALVWMTQWTI